MRRSSGQPPTARSIYWIACGYGAMVIATVAVFLLVREYGETLTAPAAPGADLSDSGLKPRSNPLAQVLLALTAVIVVGQVLALFFRRLGQPPVIGQVVAGILLGPSILGPDISAKILPADAAPMLGIIAQLGVILYMFIVGLELNSELLRKRAYSIVFTAHASIFIPFVMGAILALPLYPRVSTNEVSFTSFSLFLGVAMSITAFPVLARILSDCHMIGTRLGTLALNYAAVGDVTAWCLLALVVGIANAAIGEGLLVTASAIVYIALIYLVARPILKRVTIRWEARPHSNGPVIVVFVALLLSALAAESIGIHAIFGAFLLGAVIPHDSTLARNLGSQLEHVVTILFLPAFFAFTGMRTRIDLVTEPNQWLICGVIIAVATAGKFGGTLAAGRLTGLTWRDASILGTLMNTRGLMELIVLNVGLELGIISPTLFAMMVIMAVVTTMATVPMLRLLNPETKNDQLRS